MELCARLNLRRTASVVAYLLFPVADADDNAALHVLRVAQEFTVAREAARAVYE